MRTPILCSQFDKFIGTQISREALIGRGYFFVNDMGYVKNDPQECPDAEGYTCSDEITPVQAREYIGDTLAAEEGAEGWVKLLPTNPEDVCNETYVLVIVNVSDDYKISDIQFYAREVWDNGIDAYYFPMSMVPPEPAEEINGLIAGRTFPKESLIGKRLPSKILETCSLNGSKTEYSFDQMSGYRDVYTSVIIRTDEDGVIKDLEFEAYMNERMLMRPVSRDNDPLEIRDCLLWIVDQE